MIKVNHAGMVKLVNTLDLGSSAFACGFESHYPYHRQEGRPPKEQPAFLSIFVPEKTADSMLLYFHTGDNVLFRIANANG